MHVFQLESVRVITKTKMQFFFLHFFFVRCFLLIDLWWLTEVCSKAITSTRAHTQKHALDHHQIVYAALVCCCLLFLTQNPNSVLCRMSFDEFNSYAVCEWYGKGQCCGLLCRFADISMLHNPPQIENIWCNEHRKKSDWNCLIKKCANIDQFSKLESTNAFPVRWILRMFESIIRRWQKNIAIHAEDTCVNCSSVTISCLHCTRIRV